jgi:hypothetical protein
MKRKPVTEFAAAFAAFAFSCAIMAYSYLCDQFSSTWATLRRLKQLQDTVKRWSC